MQIPSLTELMGLLSQLRPATMESTALALFRYQAQHNHIYARYLALLDCKPTFVKRYEDIPFMPISFFKTHEVKTGSWQEEIIFSSSGTTGSVTSRHYVKDLDFYLANTARNFQHFYGDFRQYCYLALLPSYLERDGSSLIAMTDFFIRQSRFPQSGFFLDDVNSLLEKLTECQKKEIPTILLGVSFALLDLAEQHPCDLSKVIIMETGGMKGRRKEIIRKELHEMYKKAFSATHIHSEYGMTELLSQAYSKGEGRFYCGPTMQVLLRDVTDPFTFVKWGKTGLINIIDFANLHSCSFIATDDLGRSYEDGSFEVLGRLDGSDVRGCNLMVW